MATEMYNINTKIRDCIKEENTKSKRRLMNQQWMIQTWCEEIADSTPSSFHNK